MMKRRVFLGDLALTGASLIVGCADGTAVYDAKPPGTTLDAGAPPVPDEAGAIDTGLGVPLRVDFDHDWRFLLEDAPSAADSDFDDADWEMVTLPHTARVEALVTGYPTSAEKQWQGYCWYRKRFTLGEEAKDRPVWLRFEGAMNVAEVWLDGEQLTEHLGGYLPFVADLSAVVRPGVEHVLAVRLDNKDNSTTGPKPLSQLDFNWYGGLYRDVNLAVKGRLHITDSILADSPASGGLFVRFPEVTEQQAVVQVLTHVRNVDVAERTFVVRLTLLTVSGDVVATQLSDAIPLPTNSDTQVSVSLDVSSPALWSPRQPNLYVVRSELLVGDLVVDEESTRIGIRRIEISKDGGLEINGERLVLRGTNRHQEYPYVGYALSHSAQYRDAKKIKDAGFDFVRLSHYPHAPAFLDACDELGIAVMDAIPGWQYFNSSETFADVQYDNCRRMVRRDRNHPSVILWEVSLNETEMPEEFITQAHAIAHEEYPGDQCYTAGWKAGYDVYIRARQHGGCGSSSRICLVSEYGDWEYYAGNAGLNQDGWEDLAPEDANSRQLRWHGEKALLQQATNFQEAHSDNLSTSAIADGLWIMFDYNRGYADDIESSGCMDLFRLPKFSYYFFQSQRDPAERYESAQAGPMVFVASYWTAESALAVRVFSNCDEVELYLNGTLVDRRSPDDGGIASNLAHPPFTFVIPEFEPGTLEAVAFLDAEEAARHAVRTSGTVVELRLWADESGRPFAAAGKDTVIVHAEVLDADGTLVADAWENISFGTTGAATLIGANPFSSDAGISSILLQAEATGPGAAVYALAILEQAGKFQVLATALSLDAPSHPFTIYYTSDGSAPDTNSSEYEAPLEATRLRAVLVVNEEIVVAADSASEKFRIHGSAAG